MMTFQQPSSAFQQTFGKTAAQPNSAFQQTFGKTTAPADPLETLRSKVEGRYNDLRDAFRIIDRDHSGSITRDELEAALVHFNIPAHHIDDFMRRLDSNHDGVVSFAEFAAALSPPPRADSLRGYADRYVTNRHTIVPNIAGGQVLTNDNLRWGAAGGECRKDAELIELPRGHGSASRKQVDEYASILSDMIYAKSSKLRDAFRAMDVNKDGRLSMDELKRAVRMYNLPIPETHVEQVFRQKCDHNGDGQVDYEEFALALKRKDALGH